MRLILSYHGTPKNDHDLAIWAGETRWSGLELPTFRFSGGCASPGESIAVQLSGPYGSLALYGVQGCRQASIAVVSKSVSKIDRTISLVSDRSRR